MLLKGKSIETWELIHGKCSTGRIIFRTMTHELQISLHFTHSLDHCIVMWWETVFVNTISSTCFALFFLFFPGSIIHIALLLIHWHGWCPLVSDFALFLGERYKGDMRRTNVWVPGWRQGPPPNNFFSKIKAHYLIFVIKK